MRIIKKKCSDVKESDLTDQHIYQSRRDILKKLGLAACALPLSSPTQASFFDFLFSDNKTTTQKDTIFQRVGLEHQKTPFGKDLKLTSEQSILTYNNFYEFGANKSEPAKLSQSFQVNPWTLKITGLVHKPLTLGYEDLLRLFPLEERFYRMRCVEAWSMNIPWLGFPLAALLKRARPMGSARYVAFETLFDPEQMPGQKNPYLGGGIDFPYVEGLRLDEAMNPLTLLSVGLYGQTLAPQNGAPVRLVVPWKYGFKGIKSIVHIHLTEKEPPTTWNRLAANEYGFYANVNPEVDHPRWSQASERLIRDASVLGASRQPTLMFNGYAEEVASLYSGMDLRKNY